MSAATSYAVNDVVYGRLGKHINSYHKDRLGWYELSDKLILTTNVNSDNTIIIDETSLLSTTEYKMAQIILVDGSFYTIETRKKPEITRPISLITQSLFTTLLPDDKSLHGLLMKNNHLQTFQTTKV